jgi:hypothetical protein
MDWSIINSYKFEIREEGIDMNTNTSKLISDYETYFQMRMNGLKHYEASNELGISSTLAYTFLMMYTTEIDKFNEEVEDRL